jgi:hypothetical protein
MKTQIQLIQDAVANAAEGCEAFNTGIKQLFPTFLAKARPYKSLGDNVVIDFYNVADKSECASGILLNATGQMRFMMHLNGNSQHNVANSFDIELLSWSHHLRNAGLKFRKIKGKTPAEALQKMLAWYEKNAEIIKSV